MTDGAIAFGSTSSRTTAASLPPSSSVTRLRVEAALAIAFLPVPTEPVRDIFAIPGCLEIHGPLVRARSVGKRGMHLRRLHSHSSSFPDRTDRTPGGRTSWASSPNFKVPSGVKGDGLMMRQLPVTRASRDGDCTRKFVTSC